LTVRSSVLDEHGATEKHDHLEAD